jgi:hypothetical protein
MKKLGLRSGDFFARIGCFVPVIAFLLNPSSSCSARRVMREDPMKSENVSE